MKVVEIFTSIEGEGKRAGLPCTFIRLFGCNLRCEYCDTRYATDPEFKSQAKEMSVDEIIKIVVDLGCPNITITGGEPLIHPGIRDLIDKLSDRDFWVNIETNGTALPPIRKIGVFYTMDFKTNASGMTDKMNMSAFKRLASYDVLKFVVGSIDDIKQALDFLSDRSIIRDMPSVYFSPVFGKIEPKEIVEYLLANHQYNYCVQLQLHKYIFDPNARGV